MVPPMPFHIRKSVSVGAFRFNLSDSGLGMSVGVRGMRIGTGPRGNYVHMGLGGVYYRATFPKSERPTRPGPTPAVLGEPVPVSDGLTEIESGPVTAMVPASAQELLARIADAHARTRLAPIVAALAIALAGVGFLWQLHTLAVSIAVGGGLLYALAKRIDDGLNVVLLYDLEPEAQQAFQRFCAAFDVVLAADSIWRIDAQGRTYDWKRNAGASSLVRRRKLHPSYATPASIAANIDVPHLPVGKKQLFFFPDRVLVFEGRMAGAIEFAELSMEAEPNRFIEEERVPGDAQVVGYTWRFVNKSGAPDRRFNNNRQLPICRYDQLVLGSTTGLNEKLNVSRAGAAVAFAKGTYQYREDIQSLAKAVPLVAGASASVVRSTIPNIDYAAGSPHKPLVLIGAGLAGLLLLVSVIQPALLPKSGDVAIGTHASSRPPSSGMTVTIPLPATPAITDTPTPTAAAVGSTMGSEPKRQPQANSSPASAEDQRPTPAEASRDLPLLSTEREGRAQAQELYTTARVNLRSGPALSSRPIAVVDRGLAVSLLASDGEWYKVRVGAFEGWVSAKYLSPTRRKQRSDNR